MTNKQNMRIPGLFFLLAAALILLTIMPFRMFSQRLTAGELQSVLDNPAMIAEAYVEMNPQTPTGNIELELTDGKNVRASVPDVKDLTGKLEEMGID